MAADPTLDEGLQAFDDPSVDAFGMLIEAHNELVSATTKGLAAYDAPPVPWLGVLIRLTRTPGHRLRMTELARDMTMSTSGLTRLVDRVEAGGHVVRERCPEDRRGYWVVLTPAGSAAVEAIAPTHVEQLGQLIGDAIGDDELRQLTDLLRRVRDHIRGMSDSPG